MTSFFAALFSALTIFFFILIGYTLRKGKFISDGFLNVVPKLLLTVLVPALVCHILYSYGTPQNLIAGWHWLVIGLLIPVISYFLCRFALSRAKDNKEALDTSAKAYLFAFMFPNFGFMAYPVLMAVYGEAILLNWTLFTIPYYIMSNVWGIFILRPKTESKIDWKLAFNPIVGGIIVGMILALCGLRPPEFIDDVIYMLGECVTPLSMMLAGFVLGGERLREMFLNPHIYLLSLFRLLILPLIVFVPLYFLGYRGLDLALPVVVTAMPVAVNGVMLAKTYGGDDLTCARNVFLSTIFSMLTLPLVIALLGLIP